MQKLLRQRAMRFDGLSLGLDLHKRVIQYSLLDENGDELANERIAATPSALKGLLKKLESRGRVQVALEATGCFLWCFDLLLDLVGRDQVHVAAPSRVRVIAESGEKTDANDAWWLAYLTFEGRLPEAFVAEGDLRELRIAAREHRSVTEERADLMRRLKSHLLQLGISFPASDWASRCGRQRIDRIVRQVVEEHGVRGEAVDRLWKRFGHLSEEQTHWCRRVRELSNVFDEVELIDEMIPGIGPTLAPVVWSELGNPCRFETEKKYAKATGLTPAYRLSAGHRQNGKHITRTGNAHVRWALTRAIVACLRCKRGPGLVIKDWVNARTSREGKKRAIVAAARKLAEAIWRLFNLGEIFDITKAFGGVRTAG